MENFVSYEIAKKLKELGFNERCFGYYTHNTGIEMNKLTFSSNQYNINSSINLTNKLYEGDATAPLYQQVIDWLRENHSLSIAVLPHKNNDDKIELCWYYTITILGIYDIFCNADSLNASKENYESYNEALNKGIEEAIKLIK